MHKNQLERKGSPGRNECDCYIQGEERGSLMNLLKTSIMSLWLALFLAVGAGCAEQEQNSKETGKAIIDTVKDAEKNVNDAVLKMQEKTNQLEEVDQ